LHVNANQADNEADGLGDVCDPDDDNDRVADQSDNCPVLANSDQTDFDVDALGDACDPDVDGDDVSNAGDACPATPHGAVIDPLMGCSLAQLCPCEAPRGTSVAWRNHGKYVSCMTQTATSFREAGLISATQKGSTVSEAAQSSCGGR
jgi:hypothetical protein